MKKHLSLRLSAFFFYQRHMPGCSLKCGGTILTGKPEDNLYPAFFGDTLNAVIYLQQSITLH
jgi:hypothetical protein